MPKNVTFVLALCLSIASAANLFAQDQTSHGFEAQRQWSNLVERTIQLTNKIQYDIELARDARFGWADQKAGQGFWALSRGILAEYEGSLKTKETKFSDALLERAWKNTRDLQFEIAKALDNKNMSLLESHRLTKLTSQLQALEELLREQLRGRKHVSVDKALQETLEREKLDLRSRIEKAESEMREEEKFVLRTFGRALESTAVSSLDGGKTWGIEKSALLDLRDVSRRAKVAAPNFSKNWADLESKLSEAISK